MPSKARARHFEGVLLSTSVCAVLESNRIIKKKATLDLVLVKENLRETESLRAMASVGAPRREKREIFS